MTRSVLATGVSGHVGGRIVARLLADGWRVRAAVRRPGSAPAGTEEIVVGDLAAPVDWRPALDGADAVLHAAGMVEGPPALLDAVNRGATAALAEAAVDAGVGRFVLVSSLGAQAVDAAVEGGDASAALIASTPYARTKHAGEAAVRAAAAGQGTDAVVLRPAAVYGPGAPGKLGQLARIVRSGVPLPFASVDNRRSYLFVENLADAAAVALTQLAAAGGTFAVSDGEPLSLPELVRRMAAAMHRPARLFPVPPGLFRAAGRMTGRERLVDSLVGTFVADDAPIREHLDWRPPFDTDTGLARTLG